MKFNPKPGDKIICNNGEEFICCTKEDIEKHVGFRPRHHAEVLGYQNEPLRLWQDWNSAGVAEGDDEYEYSIREVIPAESKAVGKEEEARYTVDEVFSAIKQYVGYESPLNYKDGIKNLLKNLDEDPQYKEYLRLKAIYE